MIWPEQEPKLTLVDVRRIGLLPGLATLLLLARGSGSSLLSGLLLLSRSLTTSWGLATSAWLLLSGFGRHFDESDLCQVEKVKSEVRMI